MLKYLTNHLIWKLIHYLVGNANARNVLLRGITSLIIIGLVFMLFWVIVAALTLAVDFLGFWPDNLLENGTALIIILLAAVAIIALAIFASRMAWNRWVKPVDDDLVEFIDIDHAPILDQARHGEFKMPVTDLVDRSLVDEITIEK